MTQFGKIHFAILIFFLALAGCAKSTPTETIIDNHIGHVKETLDYSYNNIEQTQDIIFLENELKSCMVGLESSKQSYKAEIATCRAEKEKWQIITLGLFLIICGAIFVKIRKVI